MNYSSAKLGIVGLTKTLGHEEAAADQSRCDPYEPLMAIAWYCANANRFTQPVGSKRPNSWHVYDMTGNAEEWVHDEETGQALPPGPLTDPGGVMRDYKYRQTRGASAIALDAQSFSQSLRRTTRTW